ncbi:NADH-ubiquinone oxidoreductase 40 kDa subunit [Penicillium atrosanguineum]|uniref:NADH-ubiquinone oxidoreductase 40 kDa subunit n=1 Tax=Penicillium atrosanguineum TaxID=1132637 RepID=UPI00239DE28B|nr:NADH-ubiquinone oxidoreductase 40 kDa subunit [Penicillium atrosanguineum]KAJ5292450.1 NADH-ubiquinone oxidoreductase 40 kDa subunit [Penicillium atrosanguineum]
MKAFTLPILASFIGLAIARTDISGCVSSATSDQWGEASMIWYVPGTGEICSFIDCGGGRAPPKSEPGCPLYTGTATVTPSYLPGYGPNGKMVASTTTVSETSTATLMHTTIASSAEESSTGSFSESTSDFSATIAHSGNTMITAAPSSSHALSMTKTTSPSSKAGNFTSAAATSTETGNAAVIPAANIAGVMAIAAAVVGAFAL